MISLTHVYFLVTIHILICFDGNGDYQDRFFMKYRQ